MEWREYAIEEWSCGFGFNFEFAGRHYDRILIVLEEPRLGGNVEVNVGDATCQFLVQTI